MTRARFTSGYLLYALTVFLSAFLLFAIQPIAGKHLLPYFGGSSSVWATSLLFFTAILFLGYTYVYFITKRSRMTQMVTHGVFIAAAVLATGAALLSWGSIYPPLDWITGSTYSPVIRVLIALALSVGIPYFLLSTTGPLLQYWYGISKEGIEADASLGTQSANGSSHAVRSTSPYKLYALSNTGSLLALLCYPFLIEPYIPLTREETIWTVLFFVYAALTAAIAHAVRAGSHGVHKSEPITAPYARRFEWIAYGALPAFMLVAVTTVLTQLISPVPLLWIMPLALYLLTFIFAFSGIGRTAYMPLFVLIAGAAAYVYTPGSPADIAAQVTSYLILLFFVCLMCHAKLYELRPKTGELPYFYLCTSFGGVIGTMFASIIAPVVFNDFYEFPLGLAITAAVAAYLLPGGVFPRALPDSWIRALKIIFPFALLVLFTNIATTHVVPNTMASRNFYGAVQLSFESDTTSLMHGTTLHGLQPTDREWSFVPTTYYTQGSGIGRAERYENERAGKSPVRVGVIGLGTGSLAAYCEDGDEYVFFEIDPRIKEIATSYFSYIPRCKGAEIKIGDGRLLVQEEADTDVEGYDIFAVDAFTDDAIPSHLITKEAVQLYIDRLRTNDGIVAIHTSNRYLRLAPMLLSITRELGLTTMIVNDDGSLGYLGSGSQWVLMSKNPRIFDHDAFIGVHTWSAPEKLPASWTDNYTSLFSVLSISLF